jgi:hypothetical protein
LPVSASSHSRVPRHSHGPGDGGTAALHRGDAIGPEAIGTVGLRPAMSGALPGCRGTVWRTAGAWCPSTRPTRVSCLRLAGSTPAKVRKSIIRNSPVTRPLVVGSVGRHRRLAARKACRSSLQQPEDDFAHYAAADGPQLPAVFHDLRFLEGVVPQRRCLVELELPVQVLEFAQVRQGQGLHVYGPGDALAGREEPGDVTEQVPLGQRGRAVGRRDGATRQVEEWGGELRVNLLIRSQVFPQGPPFSGAMGSPSREVKSKVML